MANSQLTLTKHSTVSQSGLTINNIVPLRDEGSVAVHGQLHCGVTKCQSQGFQEEIKEFGPGNKGVWFSKLCNISLFNVQEHSCSRFAMYSWVTDLAGAGLAVHFSDAIGRRVTIPEATSLLLFLLLYIHHSTLLFSYFFLSLQYPIFYPFCSPGIRYQLPPNYFKLSF